MYGAPILPIWKLIHSHTRSLRPWDSLPPVSPPFWRHIAESDFFIFANHISRDHISDLWTGIFSVGSPNTTFHCHCFTLTFTFTISLSDVFQYNMWKIKKWFQSNVVETMFSQVPLSFECFVTIIALESLFPNVWHCVLLQFTRWNKTATTLTTFVWLFSSVHPPHVVGHTASGDAWKVTVWTFVTLYLVSV